MTTIRALKAVSLSPVHNNHIMSALASQITGVSNVFSSVGSGTENIKAPRHWPLCGESTGDRRIPAQKASITRKMFPFDDIIMLYAKSFLESRTCLYILFCAEFFSRNKVCISFLYHTSTRTRFRGPVYWHGLTSILAWISNYIHHQVWMKLLIHI